MKEMFCSVVVPVYNEELVVSESYRRLKCVMDSLGRPYEIIFVDDGSNDDTWNILSSICSCDKSVKLIAFSRNFGHQAAITAGMDYSSGRTVVVIDADLQDPPELIPEMLKKWRDGFDVVYGVRSRREGETFFKKASSALFYRLLKNMTDVDMPLDAGDFRLVDRKVCDALKKIPERNRYVRGLVSWLGFRQTGVEFVREKRFAGKTKYPMKKMLKLAFDGIASFSYQPLKLANWCGVIVTIVSLLFLLTSLYAGFLKPAVPPAGGNVRDQAAVDTAGQNVRDAIGRSIDDAAEQAADDAPGKPAGNVSGQANDHANGQKADDTAEQTVSGIDGQTTDVAAIHTSGNVAGQSADDAAGNMTGKKNDNADDQAAASNDLYSKVNILVAVSMLVNGIVLIAAGIIGVYVGRIYDEVKGRPLYVVKETRNFESANDSSGSEKYESG